MAARLLVLGTFLILMGGQLRMVDSFVLNEKASQFVAQRWGAKADSASTLYPSLAASGYDPYTVGSFSSLAGTVERKTVSPPRWLSWSLMSAGAVLALGYPCFRK